MTAAFKLRLVDRKNGEHVDGVSVPLGPDTVFATHAVKVHPVGRLVGK
jgi:hypothetical protein